MKQSRRIGSRFFMLLVFLFLYLPIFVLIVFSFNASKSRSVWSGFTLDWYKELFQNSMILDALWVTLAVSILAAVISTIIGTAAAIGFTNFRRRSRTVVTTINNIPLTNADIITGVSMMLFFVLAVNVFNGTLGAALGIKWNLGFVTLLIAHLTFDIPHVILCVMPKLQQLDPNIYEAAQDLGAPGFLAFRKVILLDHARRDQRPAHRLHYVHRRFRDQLLHRRLHLLHPVHGHLFHGQEAGQPGDQRPVHPALRGGGHPAGHRQCTPDPAGQAPHGSWELTDIKGSPP